MLSCLTPVSSVNIVLLFAHLYLIPVLSFLFSNESSRSRYHSRPVHCPGSLIDAIFHHPHSTIHKSEMSFEESFTTTDRSLGEEEDPTHYTHYTPSTEQDPTHNTHNTPITPSTELCVPTLMSKTTMTTPMPGLPLLLHQDTSQGSKQSYRTHSCYHHKMSSLNMWSMRTY
jgi:hypothetical protein